MHAKYGCVTGSFDCSRTGSTCVITESTHGDGAVHFDEKITDTNEQLHYGGAQ